ncbi:MAG: hypothetical protein QW658_01620 [Candidatus Bathyarchaeia archaeon]
MEFLRPKDVMQKMKVRRTYLYDLIRRGLFSPACEARHHVGLARG